MKLENKAWEIVKIVKLNPGKYSFPEVCRIVGAKPKYHYLFASGVLKDSRPKVALVAGKKNSTRLIAVKTVKLGPIGEAKWEYFASAASMPRI